MLLPVGRSGLAIAAGYAGLFALLVFPAPLALVLGLLAVRDLRLHPKKHGMGRAIHALIHGDLVVAVSFNPLTVVVLPFGAVDVLRRLCGCDTSFTSRLRPAGVYALGFGIVAFGVLRNVSF